MSLAAPANEEMGMRPGFGAAPQSIEQEDSAYLDSGPRDKVKISDAKMY